MKYLLALVFCTILLVACTPVSQPAVVEDERTPCTREYVPVCGDVDGRDITFANECEANNEKAVNIRPGECVEEISLEGACLAADNLWLEESQECEGMGQEQCESLGGFFNECASACRNDPEAEFCTLQCVVVCQFS